MTRLFIKKSAVVLVTLFISLSLAEIVLRLFAGSIIPTGLSHNEMGYIHRPGVVFTHTDPESKRLIDVSINKEGFRDSEWNTDSPMRVLVVGDSFVDAMQVQKEERFTELLQNKLNASGTAWTVYNLGVSGSGPESYIEKIKYFEDKIKPTHVVMAIFNGNDLQNINYNIDPNGGRKNYLVENGKVLPYSEKAGLKERTKWRLKILLARSYIVQLVHDAIHTLKANTQPEEDTGLPGYCVIPEPELQNSLLILDNLVAKAQSLTQAKLIILDIPDKNQFLATQTLDCDTNEVENRLTSTAKKLNIDLINLKNDLVTASTSAYFIGHLNQTGHRIIAEKLFEILNR